MEDSSSNVLVEAIKADMVLLEGDMKLLKNHKEAIEAHANKLGQLQGVDADEINQVVEQMKDVSEKLRLTNESIVKFNHSLVANFAVKSSANDKEGSLKIPDHDKD